MRARGNAFVCSAIIASNAVAASCCDGAWPGPSDDLVAPQRSRVVEGIEGETHRPLLAMWERDPWLMVLGSEVPSFVLYEDGLVVFRRDDARETRYLVAEIGAPRARSIVDRVLARGFERLPLGSSLVDGTDQPSVDIVVRAADGGWLGSWVHGLGRDGLRSSGCALSAMAPAPFLATHRELLRFRDPSERPWEPDRVEVLLWEFASPRTDQLEWPADVPRPPSPLVAPEGRPYRHAVEGRHEARLLALQRSLGNARAIRLDGRRWTVNVRRLVPADGYLHEVCRALWDLP